MLAGAELVVVVDHRGRLDPERAAAQPQPQREVDVLVVEEEALREAADLAPRCRSGIARQAPERAGTSPAGGASAIGRPWPPAQTMPVKWTGLPAELISVAPVSATSACQAAQPRPSTQGRRIASPKPGSGAASGLRMTSSSPLAAAAPALQPPAKPRLRAVLRRTRAAGASASTASGGAVGGVVVDDDQLVALAQLRQQRGQGPASSSRLFQATIRTESVGRTDAGGYSAVRAGAATTVLPRRYFFFVLPQVLIRSPYLLFLTFLPF